MIHILYLHYKLDRFHGQLPRLSFILSWVVKTQFIAQDPRDCAGPLPAYQNLESITHEQIELPAAKLLDYFWWSNKSNINPYRQLVVCMCYAGSRIKFWGPIPKLFSVTSFQELKYVFHFTDIQPTSLFFPWNGFMYPTPPTRIRTFDRKRFHYLFSEKETSRQIPAQRVRSKFLNWGWVQLLPHC